MTIAPMDNALYGLIKSDDYRNILNQISEKYSTMDQFITPGICILLLYHMYFFY